MAAPVPRELHLCYYLLEERMSCGTGICYGCAVEMHKGMRLVCKDGLMLDLREVF